MIGGRVNPSPKGKKDVGRGNALNHLRPEGWWDFLSDVHGSLDSHKAGIAWLKNIVLHQDPDYNDATPLNDILNELIHLGRSQVAPVAAPIPDLPDDQLVALFPGADLPHVPVSTMVHIDGIWPPCAPPPVPLQGRVVICQAWGAVQTQTKRIIRRRPLGNPLL